MSSLPSSLASAANRHAVRNTVDVVNPPHTLAGYSGPTMPELRHDPNANALAQRAMSILLCEIPALAAAPSVSSVPAPASRPPPAPIPHPRPAPFYPAAHQHLPTHVSQSLHLGDFFPLSQPILAWPTSTYFSSSWMNCVCNSCHKTFLLWIISLQ